MIGWAFEHPYLTTLIVVVAINAVAYIARGRDD